MTPEDRPKFAAIITGFSELKGKPLSKAALNLFWLAMRNWDYEAFENAATHLIGTCEFMPTPKDFEDLRRAGRRTAGEAWADALQCARQGGTAVGDDLVDRAVRAIGGYRSISMSDESKTHFLERRFCEHFEAMQDAEETREALPQIAYADTKKLQGPKSANDLLKLVFDPLCAGRPTN